MLRENRSASDLPQSVINLAMAVELIHTATLLHDDVIDQAQYRRCQKASHHIFDNTASILVGDFLFAKAFSCMVDVQSLDVLRTLSSAAQTIAEGEIMQLREGSNLNLSFSDYIYIVGAKTATLFAAACLSGGQLHPHLTVGQAQDLWDVVIFWGSAFKFWMMYWILTAMKRILVKSWERILWKKK